MFGLKKADNLEIAVRLTGFTGWIQTRWICADKLAFFFGGRAWTWEPRRQQYYLHNFLPEQPNLNHGNPEVRQAFEDIAEFWFDLGVDGFRLDAVHTINADDTYKDNDPKLQFKLGNLPQEQQPFFDNCTTAPN